MNILHLHKTRRGGVAIHVSYVKSELEDSSHDVDEISRNEDLDSDSFLRSYHLLQEESKAWSDDYDVIHAHDWSLAFPLIRAGVKNLVATFHAFPTNPVARLFQDYAISRLGPRAVVISPKMKLRYQDASYIPNGVDLKLFRRTGESHDGFRVGVAQGYKKEAIKRACDAAGVEFVSTRGELDYEDLPDFYSSLDAFVSLPYRQAGFNMVWTEAMACEVPYIVGTGAGIGDVLPIYKLRKSSGPKSLLELFRDGELPPLKGSREWLERNEFTWERHVESLLRIYETTRIS